MKSKIKSGWAAHKFAYVSFAICLGEMIILLALIVLVRSPGDHDRVVTKVSAITYLLGVPGCLVFAVIGVVVDDRRRMALIALILALACSYVWTLQVLV